MKYFLFLCLIFSVSSKAADCFMNYQSVCAMEKNGQYSVFINACEAQRLDAKISDKTQCQSDGRSPASIQTNILDEVESIENEINVYLAEQA